MSLFRAIVKSFVKNVGNFASGLVGVPIAGDLVVDAWNYWEKDEADERKRKAELEGYARQAVKDALPKALEAVRLEAPALTEAQRQALVDYLAQVPAAIRRSLRRPADHAGRTVPAGLALRSANDLLPFLPARLPRFKPGDQPLTNSDLELVELLGQGGFGEVWKAIHVDSPRLPPVALKFCLDAAAASSLARERDLLDHVRSVGKHEGIVQLMYTHLRANPPCLEYECVEGGDLTGVFAELHANGAPSSELVAKVILKLAKIVAFAHGLNPAIVHRDLKPANILVRRREGRLAFKITDFGIGGLWAKEALHKLNTGRTNPLERRLDTLLGAYTPLYASPEQMAGKDPDPRDDVHALGIIWFQLQTNRLSLMSLPSDWRDDLVDVKMPVPLLDLLAACIGKQTKRPTDANALATLLAGVLGSTTTASVAKTAPPPKPRPSPGTPPLTLAGKTPIPTAKFASRGPKPGDVIINNIGMKLAWIPPGKFLMGSPDGEEGRYTNEGPQHEVEISRGFYLGVYAVTQEKYEKVMKANPSYFASKGGGSAKVAGLDTRQFPIEQVSWQEASEFCRRLSEMEGKNYDLATEAEWEYACRGGAAQYQVYHFGNSPSSRQANFNQTLGRTSKVGSYPANAFGLFDMHGNVWEWVKDCYDENYYTKSPRVDPECNSGSHRVGRGGGWGNGARDCRAAYRDRLGPAGRDDDLGFRLALVPSGRLCLQTPVSDPPLRQVCDF